MLFKIDNSKSSSQWSWGRYFVYDVGKTKEKSFFFFLIMYNYLVNKIGNVSKIDQNSNYSLL